MASTGVKRARKIEKAKQDSQVEQDDQVEQDSQEGQDAKGEVRGRPVPASRRQDSQGANQSADTYDIDNTLDT